MFSLVAMVCLLSTGDCRAVEIAHKMPENKVCEAVAPLALDGYSAKHPDAKIVKWLCTDSPAYWLYRGEA